MYKNRKDAGFRLGQFLKMHSAHYEFVLGLARGGVAIASAVADALKIPFHALVVRKISRPENPEFAVGAMAPGVVLLSHPHKRGALQNVIQQETKEMERREIAYGKIDPQTIRGKRILIVDDGIATGFTMKAAIQYVKTLQPQTIGVAIPVGPPETIAELKTIIDEVFCPLEPADLCSIGSYYEEFEQLTDEEVCKILKSRAKKDF